MRQTLLAIITLVLLASSPARVADTQYFQLQTGDYLVGGPFRRPLSGDEISSFVDVRHGKTGG